MPSLLDWYTRYHSIKGEMVRAGEKPGTAAMAAHAAIEGVTQKTHDVVKSAGSRHNMLDE